ncbi:unnamed protein product [Prorocentrum cordatum]|uniref:Uncharacterized protein n=1 Tax=Prorocentrum cordatum TaxID=2364126 RepID=A0ABN9VNM0_9DINO|nr:unnamed protein product [Polarella glacialis]
MAWLAEQLAKVPQRRTPVVWAYLNDGAGLERVDGLWIFDGRDVVPEQSATRGYLAGPPFAEYLAAHGVHIANVHVGFARAFLGNPGASSCVDMIALPGALVRVLRSVGPLRQPSVVSSI